METPISTIRQLTGRYWIRLSKSWKAEIEPEKSPANKFARGVFQLIADLRVAVKREVCSPFHSFIVFD